MSYAGGMIGAGAGTVVLPGGGTIEGAVLGNIAGTALAYNIYDLASYYAAGYTDEDILDSEADFLSGLEQTTIYSDKTVIYRCTPARSSYSAYYISDDNKDLVETDDSSTADCMIKWTYGPDKVEFTLYPLTTFYTNYFPKIYYSWPEEVLPGTYSAYFPDVKWALGIHYITSNDNVCTYSSSSYRYVYKPTNANTVGSSTINSNTTEEFYIADYSVYSHVYSTVQVAKTYSGYLYYPVFVSKTLVDDSSVVYPESSTRVSSLTQAINNYNIDNSYTDNSTTVNYFLAPSGETPTSDNVVSPAIYDEETLVFTEPATGAQYQTTGWTYDYTTRTYDITLDAGTYSIDGTDVTQIVSTYGDELATITYYDASGTALATDEYSYVMMSGSGCAIEGHSYTVETTKEASCIAAGERTYTCSVCGDQYVEEISKTDHVYADHTITQEPTCTLGGISSQTCSTCGSQITEKLDALGHDWIAKEVNETTYEVPEGTSCPDCSGTEFTYTRNGVIYTCTCSDCAAEWTVEADVTYGSTTYVCSRCGESKVEADATEETQETWFTKFIYKFKWLSSVGEIYRQLIADVTSDAATAAAIADGAVTLADVTSEHADTEGETVTYTAPELAISFGASDKYGVDWANIKPLDLSWYVPHKETVDGIVSGILWLSYLFLLIKRAPGIIRGSEMVTEDRIKIDAWNFRHGK